MSALTEYFHKNYYSDMPIEDVHNAIYGNEDNFNAAVNYVQQTHYPDVDPATIATKVGPPTHKIRLNTKDFNNLIDRSLSLKAGEDYWNQAKELIEKKDYQTLKRLVDLNKDGAYTPVLKEYRDKINQYQKENGTDYGLSDLPEAKFFKEFDTQIGNEKIHFKIPIYGKSTLDRKSIEDKYEPSDGTWKDMWSSIERKRRHIRDEYLGGGINIPGQSTFNSATQYLKKVFTPSERVNANYDTGDGGLYNSNSAKPDVNNTVPVLNSKPVQPYVYKKPNKVIIPNPEVKKNRPSVIPKKEVIINTPVVKPTESKKIIPSVGLQKQESTPIIDSEPTLLFQGRDFTDRTGLSPGNYSLSRVNAALKKNGYSEVKDNRSMSYLTKIKT